VTGTLLSAAALPGWRFVREGFAAAIYAGPLVQSYRLAPDDPSSRLRGRYAGAQIASDFWYEPNRASMVALDGSIASIGLIGSARAAVGWRTAGGFFAGPEAQALWCVDYQQWRLGAHLTALHLDALEMTAAGGLAVESFGRISPYVRFGVYTRY